MQPCDLFDEIDFALYIQPPARNAHREIRIASAFWEHIKTELVEDAENLMCLELLPQNAMHLGNMQRHRSQIHAPSDDIKGSANQFPASRLKNQFRDPIARKHSGLKIRASLKTMRSISMQPMPPRHLPNRNRIPPSRLDQDVSRLIRNHGVEATHDAGQGQRFSCIGDDQVFGGELAIDTVQGFELLAIACAADDELAAFEQVEVKDVCRFAHFPQRVVGGVHGVVDRTLI